jgi:hypothetical protein
MIYTNIAKNLLIDLKTTIRVFNRTMQTLFYITRALKVIKVTIVWNMNGSQTNLKKIQNLKLCKGTIGGAMS